MEEQLLQAKIQILQHIWPEPPASPGPCLLGKADVRVRADSAARAGDPQVNPDASTFLTSDKKIDILLFLNFSIEYFFFVRIIFLIFFENILVDSFSPLPPVERGQE